MVDSIKDVFEACAQNNCLQTVNFPQFAVYDRVGQCCYICTENPPNTLCFFTVTNPSEKPINFLAIDKCLISEDNEDEKKCDCAVFDEKEFHFVEIKTASTASRSKRRVKAFEQLKHTIGLFKSKIDFTNYDVFAMVCIGCKVIYPRSTSSHMGRRMEMSMRYNVKFVEGNMIPFE